MIDAATGPYAALLLRIGLGLLFLAHADLQIRVYGLPTEVKFFRSIGLPGRLVYLTASMQLIGGIALVAGVCTRFVALLLLPIIVGTIVTVHASKGWLFTNKDGGWEYPAFWALALLVQFLLGDGAWALLPSPSLVIGELAFMPPLVFERDLGNVAAKRNDRVKRAAAPARQTFPKACRR